MIMPRFSSELLVNQRAVHHERQRINPRAHAENDSEVRLGHQCSQGAFGHNQVVAAHAQKRVSHPQRKPVDEAAHHEPAPVLHGIVEKIGDHNRHQTKGNCDRIKKIWNHSVAAKQNRAARPGQRISGDKKAAENFSAA
jgi:hypothetical protein